MEKKFSYNKDPDFQSLRGCRIQEGDKVSRRSTKGFFNDEKSAPTSWYSKLQYCVSNTTAESEY